MKLSNHSNLTGNPIRNLIYNCELKVPEAYKNHSINECVALYQNCSCLKEKDFFYNIILGKYIRRLVIVSGKIMRKNNGFAHGIPLEEFISEALLGFIDALSRFDLSKNTRFETFVEWRINGQIIDFLRRNIGIVRITRGIMGKTKANAKNILNPDQSLITENISPTDILPSCFSLTHRDVELDNKDIDKQILSENDYSSVNLINKIFFQEISEKIDKGIIGLTENEREIFHLFYGPQGFSQIEIANFLGKSEGRISIVKTRITNKIKNYLEPKKPQA